MKTKHYAYGGLILFLVFLSGIAGFFYPRNPTVSVVMPTYNRARFLPRVIESVLNQSYGDFEFVIVDDGSTDESVSVIEGFQRLDKRIVLIKNPKNRGISYSRNRGKYIAIMDSDDTAMPGWLEKQVAVLDADPKITVVSSLLYDMDQDIYIWRGPPGYLNEAKSLFNNYFGNIGNMFRKNFIVRHGISFDESLVSAEDYDFWVQIILKGGRFSFLDEPLVRVRRHTENGGTYYKKMAENRRATSKKFLKAFGVGDDMIADPRHCQTLTYVAASNRFLNILNQKSIDDYRHNVCDKEKEENDLFRAGWHARGKNWEGELIPRPNGRVYRYGTKHKGDVVSFCD
ncbi:MAG: glycosyltransferase family 2 protein, partial [Lactobacillales bacterium]|nr:glycosyltransferase family 2 protein [Lactobacillales bacterium]